MQRLTRIKYPSNGTFTAPAGVTLVDVEIRGGGGGGGGGCGGGGGGLLFAGGSQNFATDTAEAGQPGQFIPLNNIPVVPGTAYAIVVGGGGNGGTGGAGGIAIPTASYGGTGANGANGSSGQASSFGQIAAGPGVGGKGHQSPAVSGGFNGGTSTTAGLSGSQGAAFQPFAARAGITEYSEDVYVWTYLSGSAGIPGAPGAGNGSGGGGSTPSFQQVKYLMTDIESPNTTIYIPNGPSGSQGGASGSNGGNGQNAPQLGNANSGHGGLPGATGAGAGLGGVGGTGGVGSAGQAGYVTVTWVA